MSSLSFPIPKKSCLWVLCEINKAFSLPIKVFIISFDRSRYIAKGNLGYTIKGVPHLYDNIRLFINKIVDLNLISKESTARSLKTFKHDFLNCDDSFVFGIPLPSGDFHIFMKDFKEPITVKERGLVIMDADDIDKKQYFDLYFAPFLKSVAYETF